MIGSLMAMNPMGSQSVKKLPTKQIQKIMLPTYRYITTCQSRSKVGKHNEWHLLSATKTQKPEVQKPFALLISRES